MSCMCGDPYCLSCGPAQGNSRCPHCGTWTFDGGCPNPAKCEKAEADYAARLERSYLIDKILEKIAKEQKIDWIELEVPQETWLSWESMSIEQLKELAK